MADLRAPAPVPAAEPWRAEVDECSAANRPQYARVVAVFATGLSTLVMLEGPRDWRVFEHVLLPVLALTLAGTFAAARTVGDGAAGRWSGYPLRCALGGLAGGLLGLWLSALWRGRALKDVATRPISWHLFAGGLVTGVLVGIALWWLERLQRRDRWRERTLFAAQAEVLRSRAAAAEAEAARTRMSLQLLQAQVEPHFLYNALANLRYLVRHDASLALRLVEQLIRYFRVALPSLRELEVTLAQELELCTAFAQIQALRLGDRLQLEVDVADEWRAVRLPPALLLTLLENAFKHGMPEDGGVARVRIEARRGAGGMLELGVVDNGPGPRPSEADAAPGMGVKWLAERLRAVFGDRAGLRLEHAPGGGCRAVLRVPDGSDTSSGILPGAACKPGP